MYTVKPANTNFLKFVTRKRRLNAINGHIYAVSRRNVATYVSKIYWRLAIAGCCPLGNRSTWPAPASFPSILCTRAWRTICGVRASRCPCAYGYILYIIIYVMGARLKGSKSQRRGRVWILKITIATRVTPFDSFYFLRHKNPPIGRKLTSILIIFFQWP